MVVSHPIFLIVEVLLLSLSSAPARLVLVGLVIHSLTLFDNHFELNVIIVDSRHLRLLLVELFPGDILGLRAVSLHGVVHLERFQKLTQDLIVGLLSRLDVWVTIHTVGVLDNLKRDLTVVGLVHRVERSAHDVSPVGIHGSPHSAHHFLVGDLASTFLVLHLEDALDFSVGQVHSVVFASLVEVSPLDGASVALVKYAELPMQSNQTTDTPAKHLQSELLDQFVILEGYWYFGRLFDTTLILA